MPLERAQSYAGQLAGLRPQGVRMISFTGGEPLLASRQLRLLSDAAKAANMECTVVTACHWAGSDAAADHTLTEFASITNWQLSMDVFHEEFVPWDNVVRAARAALIHGQRPLIRMAASVPLNEQHLDLYGRIRSSLPDAVPIVVQPVTLNGRGKSVETELTNSPDAPAWPCIPNGMVVRFDGTVAPCCGGLVDQRDGHPFQYANADAGLLNVHMQWCTDPLLQLIRSAGFGPVLAWVREISPDHQILSAIPEHPCECCIGLWQDPALGPEIRRRAGLPHNHNKIAALTQIVFGETFMKQACTESASQPLNH